MFYEFEVLDGPADFSVTFDSDATGFLKLRTEAGDTVANLSAGQNYESYLNPGIYTLDTFLTISGTGAEGPKSGSNSFAMYFEDSTLNVNPVPLPAAAWLCGSGLLGLIGLSRRKKAAL